MSDSAGVMEGRSEEYIRMEEVAICVCCGAGRKGCRRAAAVKVGVVRRVVLSERRMAMRADWCALSMAVWNWIAIDALKEGFANEDWSVGEGEGE
jgi:hypothetical protein